MTRPRAEQVDLSSTPYYHCVSRCVRRAFLCGEDAHSGKNFDHRKQWLVDRLHALSGVFAVDVCAYAVMSNHFHLVLHVDRERAESWSEDEVLERYGRLFAASVEQFDLLSDEQRTAKVLVWRERLSSLSWMMRSLNEWMARRANREDECTGRFWEGRFKSQPLLDEAAVLTCMAYVDLNPVRAGVSKGLDDARFTSIEARLREAARRMDEDAGATSNSATSDMSAPAGLMPFYEQVVEPNAPSIPMLMLDYVALLEWTGRAVRRGKAPLRGAVPIAIQRLGIEPGAWLATMSSHGLSRLGALGSIEELELLALRQKRRWVKGKGLSRRLFRAAA